MVTEISNSVYNRSEEEKFWKKLEKLLEIKDYIHMYVTKYENEPENIS